MALGKSPKGAHAAAAKEIGNPALEADLKSQAWGWAWIEGLLHDTRYALRRLRRDRGFTITVLLTLALGIGANLAVFQILYSVLLAGLPVSHPEDLVEVHAAPTPFDQDWTVSYPAYQRLRTAIPEVSMLARASGGPVSLELPNHLLTKPRCELISDNYFTVVGVPPATGRLFSQADAAQNQGEWPAVLRYGFARDTFGSAQQAVGQHIRLNGIPFVVVGVAQERFLGLITGYAPDIWLPLALQSTGKFTYSWDSLGPGHDVELDKP